MRDKINEKSQLAKRIREICQAINHESGDKEDLFIELDKAFAKYLMFQDYPPDETRLPQ